jgi:hypothetical protein
MFVNTKKNPYMFRSFLFDHFQGAICRDLCRYYNVFRWFMFVEYLHGMWLYVYIIYLCVCLVLLSMEGLFDFHWQQHQAHTQIDDIHIQPHIMQNTQRTQISGRHCSNGTNHGIWPPEDGRIKRTETCRGFSCVYKHVFKILVFLNVKVSIF